MGTGYDCYDPKGHTAATLITPAQRRWRTELVSVMARQGFVNYSDGVVALFAAGRARSGL